MDSEEGSSDVFFSYRWRDHAQVEVVALISPLQLTPIRPIGPDGKQCSTTMTVALPFAVEAR
jgi:hypothetical protein